MNEDNTISSGPPIPPNLELPSSPIKSPKVITTTSSSATPINEPIISPTTTRTPITPTIQSPKSISITTSSFATPVNEPSTPSSLPPTPRADLNNLNRPTSDSSSSASIPVEAAPPPPVTAWDENENENENQNKVCDNEDEDDDDDDDLREVDMRGPSLSPSKQPPQHTPLGKLPASAFSSGSSISSVGSVESRTIMFQNMSSALYGANSRGSINSKSSSFTQSGSNGPEPATTSVATLHRASFYSSSTTTTMTSSSTSDNSSLSKTQNPWLVGADEVDDDDESSDESENEDTSKVIGNEGDLQLTEFDEDFTTEKEETLPPAPIDDDNDDDSKAVSVVVGNKVLTGSGSKPPVAARRSKKGRKSTTKVTTRRITSISVGTLPQVSSTTSISSRPSSFSDHSAMERFGEPPLGAGGSRSSKTITRPLSQASITAVHQIQRNTSGVMSSESSTGSLNSINSDSDSTTKRQSVQSQSQSQLQQLQSSPSSASMSDLARRASIRSSKSALSSIFGRSSSRHSNSNNNNIPDSPSSKSNSGSTTSSTHGSTSSLSEAQGGNKSFLREKPAISKEDYMALRDISHRMSDAETGLLTQTRTVEGRKYPATFTGSEAITWITENVEGYSDHRELALHVGRELLRQKLITHIRDLEDFEDNSLLYEFRAAGMLNPIRPPSSDNLWDNASASGSDRNGRASMTSNSSYYHDLVLRMGDASNGVLLDINGGGLTGSMSGDSKKGKKGKKSGSQSGGTLRGTFSFRKKKTLPQYTFSGSNACTWIQSQLTLSERSEAVEVGRDLLSHGFILAVVDGQDFLDSQSISYKFSSFITEELLSGITCVSDTASSSMKGKGKGKRIGKGKGKGKATHGKMSSLFRTGSKSAFGSMRRRSSSGASSSSASRRPPLDIVMSMSNESAIGSPTLVTTASARSISPSSNGSRRSSSGIYDTPAPDVPTPNQPTPKELVNHPKLIKKDEDRKWLVNGLNGSPSSSTSYNGGPIAKPPLPPTPGTSGLSPSVSSPNLSPAPPRSMLDFVQSLNSANGTSPGANASPRSSSGSLPPTPQPPTSSPGRRASTNSIENYVEDALGSRRLSMASVSSPLAAPPNPEQVVDAIPSMSFEEAVLVCQSHIRRRLTVKKLKENKVYQRAKKRYNIIKELLKTEDSYVRDIEITIDVFMTPLEKGASVNIGPLTQDQVEKIFGRIRIILNLNFPLLEALDRIVYPPLDGTPVASIGTIFLRMAPYFNMYSDYINGYNDAVLLTKVLEEKNSAFRDFLDQVKGNPVVKRKQLQSFLILPVQRIMRYPMLLSELIKVTPTTHSDYENLTEANRRLKDIAAKINEKTGAHNSSKELIALQQRFGGSISLVEPHRRFIRSGTIRVLLEGSVGDDKKDGSGLRSSSRRRSSSAADLAKGETSTDSQDVDTTTTDHSEATTTTTTTTTTTSTTVQGEQNLFVILCSDILVIASEGSDNRLKLLSRIEISSIATADNPRTEFSYIVSCPDSTLTFTASSLEEKLSWVHDLDAALEREQSRLHSFREVMSWSKLKPSGPAPPPLRNHSLSIIGRSLFIFGGRFESGEINSRLYVCSLNTNTWIEVKTTGPSPSGREFHSAVVISAASRSSRHKRLVIFGGSNGVDWFNDTHVLDTETLAWSKPESSSAAHPPPPHRAGQSFTLVDRKYLVLFGGKSQEDTYYNDLWILDPSKWRWRNMSEAVLGRENIVARAFHAAAVVPTPVLSSSGGVKHKDILFIFGGETEGEKHLADLISLSSLKQKLRFKNYGSLGSDGRPLAGRSGHSLQYANGKLVSFGGRLQNGTFVDELLSCSLSATVADPNRDLTSTSDEASSSSKENGHQRADEGNDSDRSEDDDNEEPLWSSINSVGTTPPQIGFHAGCVLKPNVVIMGGMGEIDIFGDLYLLNTTYRPGMTNANAGSSAAKKMEAALRKMPSGVNIELLQAVAKRSGAGSVDERSSVVSNSSNEGGAGVHGMQVNSAGVPIFTPTSSASRQINNSTTGRSTMTSITSTDSFPGDVRRGSITLRRLSSTGRESVDSLRSSSSELIQALSEYRDINDLKTVVEYEAECTMKKNEIRKTKEEIKRALIENKELEKEFKALEKEKASVQETLHKVERATVEHKSDTKEAQAMEAKLQSDILAIRQSVAMDEKTEMRLRTQMGKLIEKKERRNDDLDDVKRKLAILTDAREALAKQVEEKKKNKSRGILGWSIKDRALAEKEAEIKILMNERTELEAQVMNEEKSRRELLSRVDAAKKEKLVIQESLAASSKMLAKLESDLRAHTALRFSTADEDGVVGGPSRKSMRPKSGNKKDKKSTASVAREAAKNIIITLPPAKASGLLVRVYVNDDIRVFDFGPKLELKSMLKEVEKDFGINGGLRFRTREGKSLKSQKDLDSEIRRQLEHQGNVIKLWT